MAGNTPTLTNENYHIFEPSPIETSLAAQVDDPTKPSAFPLLMSYRARNQMSGDQYQAQLDQMHAIQQQQALANQANARAETAGKNLKVIGDNPGAGAALRSAGLLPDNMDISDLDRSAVAKALATNLGNGGRGLGAMAMGGFTGLAPAAQSVAGPGVGQGPAAIVQAAQVKAASRGGSGGGGGSGLKGSLDDDGGFRVTGKMLPGETADEFRARAGGGTAPPTFMDRAAAKRSGQTSLPQAPQTGAPVTTKPSQVPLSGPDAGTQQAVRKGLINLHQTNPAGYADVRANQGKAIVPHASGIGAKGASGQVYPLQTQ